MTTRRAWRVLRAPQRPDLSVRRHRRGAGQVRGAAKVRAYRGRPDGRRTLSATRLEQDQVDGRNRSHRHHGLTLTSDGRGLIWPVAWVTICWIAVATSLTIHSCSVRDTGAPPPGNAP